MADEKSDVIIITSTGNIGALAAGRGATAIQASGNARINTEALDAQFAALGKIIEQHRDSVELKLLLQEAIDLAKSDNPSASKPILEKIAQYGGAIGSMVSGIVGILSLGA